MFEPKNYQDCEDRWGCYEADGYKYALLQDEYVENDYFTAIAIRKDAEIDEDGYQKCYRIKWKIDESGVDHVLEPYSIEEECTYSFEYGCY